MTENETNTRRLFGSDAPGPFKDGINDAVVNGQVDALSTEQTGIQGGGALFLRDWCWWLADIAAATHGPGAASFGDGLFGVEFDRLFDLRREEADEFYAAIIPDTLSADAQQSCVSHSPACCGPSSSIICDSRLAQR